ncbi:MAG: adenylosuccinate synthase [Thermoplasmatales archaeon]
MNTLTVVGCQFGDEGKGKVIDFLSENYDITVRFNGGENAGHTVVVDGNTIKFHLVPAGFLRSRTSVIANGVVVNLRRLVEEIEFLSKYRGKFDLRISHLAHIVTDLHLKRDKYLEELRGKGAIGTTLKGIGPAYESKYGRYGMRIVDLFDPKVVEDKLEFLSKIYGMNYEKSYINSLLSDFSKVSKYVADTRIYLKEEIEKGSGVLFETANGTFIDVDYGTYPYVTSSHTTSPGVTVGTGLPPKYFSKFLGVAKAYTTRVGEGIFPTELTGPIAEHLRKIGNEYGSTTGRPRRVGYLDIPMLRAAVDINALDYIALTKVDVLGKLKEIKAAVSYEVNGSEVYKFDPSNPPERVNYEVFEPWAENSANLEKYVEFVESQLKVPIVFVGNGEKRDSMISRGEISA